MILSQDDPPVKSYDQISFWPDFPIVVTMGGVGGPVLREGGIFGINAFSDISFYWLEDQESTFGILNFPKKSVIVKQSIVHPHN